MENLDRILQAFACLGDLQTAMRQLREKCISNGFPTTLWFDLTRSQNGVLIQGFVDVELPNGNAISSHVDISGNYDNFTIEATRRLTTNLGQDFIDGLDSVDCRTETELMTAIQKCITWVQKSEIPHGRVP